MNPVDPLHGAFMEIIFSLLSEKKCCCQKYACRKTLADNRPRIRGRFARNDEIGDVAKAAGSNRDDDDDEFLWVRT